MVATLGSIAFVTIGPPTRLKSSFLEATSLGSLCAAAPSPALSGCCSWHRSADVPVEGTVGRWGYGQLG